MGYVQKVYRLTTLENNIFPLNSWQVIFVCFISRFFNEIASDSQMIDSMSFSMSFISDANVFALHRLLWNHQEKMGLFLSSSRDHRAVGRRPFDKMITLLAYIGPPEHPRLMLDSS